MARILVYTAPALGHVFPLVPGLLDLQGRGHVVHLRTAPGALPHLSAVGLDASPVDPRVTEVEVSDHRARTDQERRIFGLSDVVERGDRDGADLDAAVLEHRPDVLLVDCLAYGALTRAEASGLPWALTLPSLLPLPERGIPPYGLGMRPAAGPLGPGQRLRRRGPAADRDLRQDLASRRAPELTIC
jgi:UDP:flavonoid glycosyltransferase YjiC (YdhE family)